MYINSIEFIYICKKIKQYFIMQQLREALVKKITDAKNREEVETIVLEAIVELRAHWVCEFVIAVFINKLIKELKEKEIKHLNDEELFSHILSLHPQGYQWDL